LIKDFNVDLERPRIVEYSVQRATRTACWFLGKKTVDKIKFINDYHTLEGLKYEQLKLASELNDIVKNDEEINRRTGSEIRVRREFGEAVDILLSPEFDRLELDLSQNTQILREQSRLLRQLLEENKQKP
jgi:hypothetical protein